MRGSHDIRKKVELYSIALLLILTVSYGVFRIYPLLRGPSITIFNPHDGDTVPGTIFEVSGEVSPVKEITLQGRPIPVDESGHFTEIIVAELPYTIIILTATDTHGKTITKRLTVTPKE